MTRDDLLTRLSQLLPSQFDEAVFRASVPTAYLPGDDAPHTKRAIAAIRVLEQQKRLHLLARILDEVAAIRSPTCMPGHVQVESSDPGHASPADEPSRLPLLDVAVRHP